jgi:hypothetical protein
MDITLIRTSGAPVDGSGLCEKVLTIDSLSELWTLLARYGKSVIDIGDQGFTLEDL